LNRTLVSQTKALTAKAIPQATLQRKIGDCEECRDDQSDLLQRKSAVAGLVPGVPPIVHQVLGSSGQPLDAGARAFMEPRFGHDFSQVRIHTDDQAQRSAKAVDALAYTVGSHVVFGSGQYSPDSPSGRKLLAHELTHTVQQGTGMASLPAISRVSSPGDPAEGEARQASAAISQGRSFRPRVAAGFHISRQGARDRPIDETYPDQDPGTKQAEEFAVATLSVVKDPILEALHRSDSIDFLYRLRAVAVEDRPRLLADQPFMDEMRHYFRGLPLWTVILILTFGNNRPENARRLYMAVSDHNYRLVKDLIRSDPDLRSEVRTPGAREMLNYELRGTPDHDEVLRLMDQQETTGRYSLASGSLAVHYETRSGFWNELVGNKDLMAFGGSGSIAYELARTANELRVIVRIHFVKDRTTNETAYPDESKANQWRAGIEAAWNKPFYAWNGTTQLTIVFVPLFVAQAANHTVLLTEGSAPSQSATERGNEHHWFTTFDGPTAAHEFGHMLGNPDEYRLPATAAEIPASMGLTPAQTRRTNVQDINRAEGRTVAPVASDTTLPGIMGTETGTAEKRHIQPILEFYNSSGKPRNESDYHIL